MAFVKPMDRERWLPIAGWEGVYEVSDFGRVRRSSAGHCTYVGRILKPYRDRYGYMKVNLRRPGIMETRMLHHMVATAFLGPRPCGHEIDHKKPNTLNNCLSNLEYVTPQENQRRAAALGRRAGLFNANAKLSPDDVREIREKYDSGSFTQQQLATVYGVSQVQISNVVRQKKGGWNHVN